jgi:hypothetical protein
MKIGGKLITYGTLLTILGLGRGCPQNEPMTITSGDVIQSDGEVRDAVQADGQVDGEVAPTTDAGCLSDASTAQKPCSECEPTTKKVVLVSQELRPGEVEKSAPVVEGDSVKLKLEAGGREYEFNVGFDEEDRLVLESKSDVTYNGKTGKARIVVSKSEEYKTKPSTITVTTSDGIYISKIAMKEETRDTINTNYESRTAVLVVVKEEGERAILKEGGYLTKTNSGDTLTVKVEKATNNGAFLMIKGNVDATLIEERLYLTENLDGNHAYQNGSAIVSVSASNNMVDTSCKEYKLVFKYGGEEIEAKVGDTLVLNGKYVKVEDAVYSDESNNPPIVKISVDDKVYYLKPQTENASPKVNIGGKDLYLESQVGPTQTCVEEEQIGGAESETPQAKLDRKDMKERTKEAYATIRKNHEREARLALKNAQMSVQKQTLPRIRGSC